MVRSRLLSCTLPTLMGLALCAHQVTAQNRIQFPTMSQVPVPVAPPTNVPRNTVPSTTFGAQLPPAAPGTTPWVPVPNGAAVPSIPGATLGQQIQPFDPYANATVGGPNAGAILGPPPPNTVVGPSLPGATFPGPYAPSAGTTYVPPNVVGPTPNLPGGNWQPVVPPGSFPPTVNPSLNQTVVPGALPGAYGSILPPPPLNGAVGIPSASVPQAIVPAPVFPEGVPWGTERLFQDTGFLYTYLYGKSGDDLTISDVELFTSAVFKNFAHSPNGLRVTPGFIFTFLDGPDVPGPPEGISLPGQLYSAYIDALWQPQITPQFSADLNVRVGVYSDFQAFSSDSLRYPSRALGVLQVTPTTALKLGVEYLDRVDVKLLPAGGVVWTPNDQTYFDIYFPRPKLAQYLSTYGNTEMWWYIGGEYGESSWTFEREASAAVDPGGEEQIDINDIRVYVGIDWNNLDRFNGLMEIGYVFEREIVVRNHPDEQVNPGDTFMVRAGLRF